MAEGNLMISESEGVTVAQIQMTAIQDERAINSIGRALFALVDERDVKKLIVDFRSVNFLSSQMIGTLMTLHKKAKAIDGMVVLAGLKPSLMKVFTIMKLTKVLNFAADEKEALGMFPAF